MRSNNTILVVALVCAVSTGSHLSGQEPLNFGAKNPPQIETTRMLHPHPQTLIFSADGKSLLSLGYTPRDDFPVDNGQVSPDIRVWDVATGRMIKRLLLPSCYRWFVFSPDDRFLAAALDGGKVHLLDKSSLKKLAEWEIGSDCSSLAFSADSKSLIALIPVVLRIQTQSPPNGDPDGATVCIWDVATQKQTAWTALSDVPNVDFNRHFGRWSLTPNGAVAIRAFHSYTKSSPACYTPLGLQWHFWDTTTGKQCRPVLKTRPEMNEWWISSSTDGRTLALLSLKNRLEVWDTISNQRVLLSEPNSWLVKSKGNMVTELHPDGKMLVLNHRDTVALRAVTTNKDVWRKSMPSIPPGPYNRLAFSQDGKTLAAANVDGEIILLDTATGNRRLHLAKSKHPQNNE